MKFKDIFKLTSFYEKSQYSIRDYSQSTMTRLRTTIGGQDFNPLTLKLEKKPFIYGSSLRTGVLGYKQGMIGYFNPITGIKIPCTIVSVDSNITLWSHSNGRPSSWTKCLDIGAGDRKSKSKVHVAQQFYLKKCGLEDIKKDLSTFRVSKDGLLPPGTPLYASHFIPGQLVDVQSTSIGKGFQGAMKRWGFKGMPASHGVSLSHRSIGSTGSRQDPGKVFKGKKMAGRMGGKKRSILRLEVLKIDTKYNCLFIKGNIPGPNNGLVRIKDSQHNPLFKISSPPFPTYIPSSDDTVNSRELLPEKWIMEGRRYPVDNTKPISKREVTKLG